MTTETTTTQPAAATTTEGTAASNPATETATGAETATTTQQTTEGQATETAAAAETGKTEGEMKPAGAPEQYDFKAGEGQEFNPKVLESFSKVAKELNLTNESAQKILDEMAPALVARNTEVLNEARTQWGNEVKADKEIGGEKVAENIAIANKTFEKFGTPELRALLDATGLGDHPEVLRWAYRAGKAMSEDGFVASNGGQHQPQSTAQRMYPNMNP